MDQIVAGLAQAGSMGLFVAYMIWDKCKEREAQKERIEADKVLASALTALTIAINARVA